MLNRNWSQLDTAGACQRIVITHPSFIDNIFSIQNTRTNKHIGLDLSDVIKHITAPDWASMSKNIHRESGHWINYMLKQKWSQLDTAGACQSIVITQPSFIDNTFSIQNTCTTKHIGLDLSDVIKHIHAPDWASMSKNIH